METISKNSKNSKTFDPNRLLNLSDKINLKRTNKHVALSNLILCYTWRNSYKNNKSKISTQRGMINLNYLIGHIPI